MQRRRGQLLLALLREFPSAVMRAPAPPGDLDRSEWDITGMTWKAKVIVDPQRWIGLEFEVQDSETGRSVQYAIDTDLYDITQDTQQAFAEAIESDIVEFLSNLKRKAVLMRSEGSTLTVIFPQGASYVSLSGGRLSTTATRLTEKPANLAAFIPLV